MGSLFCVHRKADPDPSPVCFATLLATSDRVEINCVDHLAQRLRVIAAVKMFARDIVEWHLLGTDKTLETHFGGFNCQFPRQRIDH